MATAAATGSTTTAAALLGLLDGNLASLDVTPIELLDRLAGLVLGRHLDEAESTRATGFPVSHDLRVRDGAEPGEQVAQVELSDE